MFLDVKLTPGRDVAFVESKKGQSFGVVIAPRSSTLLVHGNKGIGSVLKYSQ